MTVNASGLRSQQFLASINITRAITLLNVGSGSGSEKVSLEGLRVVHALGRSLEVGTSS